MVRGGGELASAAARALHLGGFRVVVLERALPLAVRRRVSFAEAVLAGRAWVEAVEGRRLTLSELPSVLDPAAPAPSFVAVLVDPEAACREAVRPDVLVDGRMLKRAADVARDLAPLVVGLGPGFVAGQDVHAVVETRRGPDLGRVIGQGRAHDDDGVPGLVGGEAGRRVLRAPTAGVFRAGVALGSLVTAGQVVGHVDGTPVRSAIDGRLRGLLADGVPVEASMKLGDVDPRGSAVDPDSISDKGHAVAAGVMAAVQAFLDGPSSRMPPASRNPSGT